MDCQTEMLLAKLQEKVRLRHQHASAARPSGQTLTPQIKMIVGDWYTDMLILTSYPSGTKPFPPACCSGKTAPESLSSKRRLILLS